MKSTRLISRATRTLLRHNNPSIPRTSILLHHQPLPNTPHHHTFSTTCSKCKGLQPDTANPASPNPQPHNSTTYNTQPASLQDSEYHELADEYMNTLLLTLEQKVESAPPGEDYDVEYSAGVLTHNTPHGTYVINKQPPNKQIWLSSPMSGPKRYDWVLMREGQHMKEGTEVEVGDDGRAGGGKWIYLRDGSSLTGLLREEVGVEVALEQAGEWTGGSG